jgi:hypothetical protein
MHEVFHQIAWVLLVPNRRDNGFISLKTNRHRAPRTHENARATHRLVRFIFDNALIDSGELIFGETTLQ